MGKKWTIRGLIWILVAAVAMLGVPLFPASSVQAAEYATAKLTNIKGGVYVKKSGGGQEFQGFNGMILTQGDWIRTGSDGFAEISYENGTETSLDTNTQVLIERLTSDGESSQTTVKLTSGGIWNKVKSFLNIDDEYEVETPTAVLGVRGTLYYVSQDNLTGTSRGVVVEGQVNGQENNNGGIGREQDLFTGQELEFRDTPGQRAHIRGIDHHKLIAQSQPRILGEILLDLNLRLTELLDLANRAQATYPKDHDIDTLRLACLLADQARELSHFAVEFIRNVEGSQKADAVDDILREHHSNLDQLQSGLENLQKESDQIWSETQELAQENDLSMGDINTVLNQGFDSSRYGEIVRAIAQASPSNGSNGSHGSNGNNGNGNGGNNDDDDDQDEDDGDEQGTVVVLNTTPTRGSLIGTTQFASLPTLPVGAVKFQIKVQTTAFGTPNFNDVFGGTDYVVGDNISATVSEYIALAAVDDLNRIKGFCSVRLISAMVKSNDLTTKIRVNSIQRASLNSDEVQGDDTSFEASISSDGKRVVFLSYADNLVSGTNPSYQNIYVRYRQTGETEQVNVNSAQVKVPGAMQPIISDNGRYVAFRSDRNGLVPEDTNNRYDIFVRDLDQRTTVQISVSTNSTEVGYGNIGPGWPSISGDGRYVVFSSDYPTLEPSITIQDIFVRDRDTDEDGIFDESDGSSASKVNISSLGDLANKPCYFPVISADGRFVAYESKATNLVPGVTAGGIFVRDLQENKTVYIAQGMDPDLSDDGRYIVYENQNYDLMVMDRDSDGNGIFDEADKTNVETITLNANGQDANANCYSPKISGDGRYVVYYTAATNLVPVASNGLDHIYLYDRVTQTTKLLSASKTGWPANDYSGSPFISKDAKYVVYNSSATNLVTGDSNNKGDVFVLELDLNSPLDTEPPVFNSGSGLASQEIGPSWLKLTWNEATDNIGISGYAIYRGTDPQGPFVKVASLEPSVRSYWDTNLNTNTNYYYYVLAGDEDENWSVVPTPLQIKTTPEPALTPKIVPIAAGDYHSLARTAEGFVWAWGDNDDGQLGDGSEEVERLEPVQVVGTGGIGFLTNVAAVAAQGNCSTALKNDGTVWTWGDNANGLLGIGTRDYYSHNSPVQVLGYEGIGYLTNVTDIATSEYHTLALKNDGTVWAWGDNLDGDLGDGTETDRTTPVPVKDQDGTGFLTNVIAIAVGDAHSLALKSDGTVWTWGQNDAGQLGIGSADGVTHSLPRQVPGLNNIRAIGAGQYHSMAIQDDGTVWAWGENIYGEIGNGTSTKKTSPVKVLDESGTGELNGITSIAGGLYFTLAIKNDQSVWSWGYNSEGQLGQPIDEYQYLTPAAIQDLSGITHAACGEEHSLLVKSDGTVLALGNNSSGQLGIGTSDSDEHTDPVEVKDFNLNGDVTPPLEGGI